MKEAEQSAGKNARLFRLSCYAIIVTSVCVWIIDLFYVRFMIPSHAVDFDSYYSAAQALRFDPTANIYAVTTLLHIAQAHNACAYFGPYLPPYLYPPFLAIILEPLTFLPCAAAGVLWFYFNTALWALATLILADLLARRWPQRRLELMAIVALTSFCFLNGMYGLSLGQIHLVILLGIVLALWLIDHGHPWLAGGALAVITVIKILPALLIVYYLVRRRWRVVSAAALAGLAMLGLMLAVSGPATLAGGAKTLVALSGSMATVSTNEALVAVTPLGGRMIAILVGCVSISVVWRRAGDDLLGLGWMLCAMLLLSPLVWSFYLIWLLPTFVACFATLDPPQRLRGKNWRTWTVWAALALLYMALAFPSSLDLRPFATLALWAVTGALYWRSSTPAGVASLMAQPETVAVAMSES